MANFPWNKQTIENFYRKIKNVSWSFENIETLLRSRTPPLGDPTYKKRKKNRCDIPAGRLNVSPTWRISHCSKATTESTMSGGPLTTRIYEGRTVHALFLFSVKKRYNKNQTSSYNAYQRSTKKVMFPDQSVCGYYLLCTFNFSK